MTHSEKKKPVCVVAGNLEVRIAHTPDEVRAAQELRYAVFYSEMGAQPSHPDIEKQKRDFDEFDPFCDHLIAIEHGDDGAKIIGTYRMLRRSCLEKIGRFYSSSEFDISPIIAYKGEILEVGRSCVNQHYRSRSVLQILWQGIAAYIYYYDVKLLFGCASLHGTDVQKWSSCLSYLHHYHRAPMALRAKALPEQYIDMNLHALEAVDKRAAILALPPLVKGYLRLGGFVGEGAVVDKQFNTIDICVIVDTSLIKDKYAKHYARSNKDTETS